VFEQAEWNEVMSSTKAGAAVRVGVLSPILFPTGCIYFGCRVNLHESDEKQLGEGKVEGRGGGDSKQLAELPQGEGGALQGARDVVFGKRDGNILKEELGTTRSGIYRY